MKLKCASLCRKVTAAIRWLPSGEFNRRWEGSNPNPHARTSRSHPLDRRGNAGSWKPSLCEVIRESDGKVTQSQEHRLKRWAAHFKVRFSWSTTTMDLPLIPVNGTMEVDINRSSKMEIIQEIRLKRHKIAGPDGLSPSVLKDDGGVGIKINKTSLINLDNRRDS